MRTRQEQGIALVLALFLMSALSVLAASLMFLSQTETYASMNYRMMSQARYGAEAGVQKAGNFLLDPAQYAMPAATGSDPLTNYDTTKSPVQYNGHDVVLSATSGANCSNTKASNYPYGAVQTAFSAAAQGSLSAGTATIAYCSYATLIAMQTFDSYGGGQAVVQTWRLTSDGALSGARRATVEVEAIIETPKMAASSYGAFANANTCGALNFSGNVTINSYDSTGMTGTTTPTMSTSGGDVGTNGNLTIGGSVDVRGNLYTPRTGVGSCTEGNVTALTDSGHATVEGSTIQLPKAVMYPTPTIPVQSSLSAVNLSSAGTSATTCALFGLTAGTSAQVAAGTSQCNVTGSTITINGNGTTLSLPELSLSSHINLVLTAGGPPASQYNFNSISLSGGSSIGASATSSAQAVIVDVVGKDSMGNTLATPIDLTGGTYTAVTGCATCSAYDASILQFVYGGTSEVKMAGNSNAAATFYAPNALVTFSGTSDLYGSLLANTINEVGSGNIHYDRRLQHDFWVAGSPMIGTFTWKRSS
jgi:hypothetical protein